MCLIIEGVDSNGNHFRAFQCGCGSVDPDDRMGMMEYRMMEAEHQAYLQSMEDWEAFKRHEPNKSEFRVRSKHVQLGFRVNKIPASARRI